MKKKLLLSSVVTLGALAALAPVASADVLSINPATVISAESSTYLSGLKNQIETIRHGVDASNKLADTTLADELTSQVAAIRTNYVALVKGRQSLEKANKELAEEVAKRNDAYAKRDALNNDLDTLRAKLEVRTLELFRTGKVSKLLKDQYKTLNGSETTSGSVKHAGEEFKQADRAYRQAVDALNKFNEENAVEFERKDDYAVELKVKTDAVATKKEEAEKALAKYKALQARKATVLAEIAKAADVDAVVKADIEKLNTAVEKAQDLVTANETVYNRASTRITELDTQIKELQGAGAKSIKKAETDLAVAEKALGEAVEKANKKYGHLFTVTVTPKDIKDAVDVALSNLVKPEVLAPAELSPVTPVKEGWNKDANGNWTFGKDGKLATGWVKDSGKWYFLGQDGVMKKWWNLVDGKWYFLNGSGAMETGWLLDNGKWYFLEASGAMKASQWFELNGKWYYVNGLGELAVNTTVDGYTVNGNGEWVK